MFTRHRKVTRLQVWQLVEESLAAPSFAPYAAMIQQAHKRIKIRKIIKASVGLFALGTTLALAVLFLTNNLYV